MVHILKEGTRNEVTCKNCASLLSYLYTDVKTKDIEIEDGRRLNNAPYIKCPVCGEDIILMELPK